MLNTRTQTRVWGLVLILPLLLVALPLQGQAPSMQPSPEVPSVDEEELDEFVDAYIEVQNIQIELSERMSDRLSESDLGTERFQEIDRLAQESEPQSGLPGVDSDELAEYQEVRDELLEVQSTLQNDMVDAVESRDFSVERFNEIILGIQQDEELAARAQQLLAEKSES